VSHLRKAYEVVQQAWSSQRWDDWLLTCAQDYVFHPGRGLALDREQTITWNRALFAAFPDYTEDVRHVHVADGTVVAELVGRGTSTGDFVLFGRTAIPASGKSFELRYAKVLVFNSDSLVRLDRQYQDRLDLFAQLGDPGP